LVAFFNLFYPCRAVFLKLSTWLSKIYHGYPELETGLLGERIIYDNAPRRWCGECSISPEMSRKHFVTPWQPFD